MFVTTSGPAPKPGRRRSVARRLGPLLLAVALASAGATPRAVLAPAPAPPAPRSGASADTDWDLVRLPEPAASYGSFAAACDSARRIVARALGAWADSATWTPGRIRFGYRDSLAIQHDVRGQAFVTFGWRLSTKRVPSLAFAFQRATDQGPDVQAIENAFVARGWARNETYTADGPDGEVLALECREALFQLEARWDGGDDSDTTTVPAAGISVIGTIVPRPAPDPRIPPRPR